MEGEVKEFGGNRGRVEGVHGMCYEKFGSGGSGRTG